jgi:hypothetical protein
MREQLPYMSDEQFDRIAFVYRSKEDGIRVVGLLEAKNYEDRTKYQHLATIDPHAWIEYLLRNSPRERSKQIKQIEKP